MSADWIDDDIARLTQRQNAVNKAADVEKQKKALQDAESAHAKAQLPAVFEQLLQAVKANVELFNSKFKDQGQKHLSLPQRIGSNQFRVERGYAPTFWLNVTLNDDIPAFDFIRIVASRTDTGGIFIAPDLKCSLKGAEISIEDASKELLRLALASLYE